MRNLQTQIKNWGEKPLKSSYSFLVNPVLKYSKYRCNRENNNVYVFKVSPNEIEYIKLFNPFNLPVTGHGSVCGPMKGPWDYLKRSFENHYIYKSINSRVNGNCWEDTDLYYRSKYRNNRDKFEKDCNRIDDLIESISASGYKRQKDINNQEIKNGRNISGNKFPDEVIIGMGRRGELIHLRGGRHRLSIAKVLGVEEIPVILSIYHPKSADQLPGDEFKVDVN